MRSVFLSLPKYIYIYNSYILFVNILSLSMCFCLSFSQSLDVSVCLSFYSYTDQYSPFSHYIKISLDRKIDIEM